MDANAVRDLYQTIFGKSYIETGPRLVSKINKKYISQRRLLAIGDPFIKDMTFKAGPSIIDVPSPWHALCVAMRLQDRALSERQLHLVFRGQSNSSYSLVASIFRKGANEKVLGRAKRLLAWYLAANAGLNAATDPSLFYGAAQHYQIWTNLLDITPDPAVAVWFAAQPTKSDCPTSSVYVFPLEAAERMGVNLRLPPPFVQRLHRQRGLFIECTNSSPLPMDEIIEIRFPARRNSRMPFNVIRGQKETRLLDDSDWIRKAVTWAKKTAEDDSVEVPTAIPTGLDPKLALFLKAMKTAGVPTALLSPKRQQLYIAQWLDHFNDQLYWLAYRFYDSNVGNEELLELRHLQRIVRTNVDLARLYVQFGRALGAERPASFHDQLDLIESTIVDLGRAIP